MLNPRSLLDGIIGRCTGALLGIVVTGQLILKMFPASHLAAGALELMGVAALLCLLTSVTQGTRRSASDALLALSAGLVVGIVVVAIMHPETLKVYGDGEGWLQILTSHAVFPRWLGGTSILSQLLKYSHLDRELDIALLARLFGAVAMIAWIGSLATFEKSSLGLVLVLASPLWIVFCLGHLEYYPLIAGAAPFMLTFAMGRDEQPRSALELGVLAACSVWLYIGYVPLAAILLYMTLGSGFRAALLGAGAFVCTLWALIHVSYPGGGNAYLIDLPQYLNLGSQFLPPQYASMSAGPNSPFFTLDGALKSHHLMEVSKMLFFGAGPSLIALLPLGALLFVRTEVLRPSLTSLFATSGAVLLAIVSAFYCLFMIPRLGPRMDIDLFFLSYFSFWFLTGKLLDGRVSPLIEDVITYAVLGSSLVLAFGMVSLGVPRFG